MLLCDAAQAVGGKLYILGAGWSQVINPEFPTSMVLAIKLGIPWDQANDPHRIIARLMTADGDQVELPNPQDDEQPIPVRVEGMVETGRPPGLAPGTEIDAPLVADLGDVALPTTKSANVLTDV